MDNEESRLFFLEPRPKVQAFVYRRGKKPTSLRESVIPHILQPAPVPPVNSQFEPDSTKIKEIKVGKKGQQESKAVELGCDGQPKPKYKGQENRTNTDQKKPPTKLS